jgi:hypothetical protein
MPVQNMGWFTSDGETRKRTEGFADIEEHFDADGKKIGETRKRQGFYKETFDANGRKVSETRKEPGFYNDKEVTRGEDGSTTETHRESTGYGTKEVHTQDGRKIGESHVDSSSHGRRKAHYNHGNANFDPVKRTNRNRRGSSLERRAQNSGGKQSGRGVSVDLVNMTYRDGDGFFKLYKDSGGYYIVEERWKGTKEVEEKMYVNKHIPQQEPLVEDSEDSIPSEVSVKNHYQIEQLVSNNYPNFPSELPTLVISKLDSPRDIQRAIDSHLHNSYTWRDVYINTYRCTACEHEWTEKNFWNKQDVDCVRGCSNPGLLRALFREIAGKKSMGHGDLIHSEIVRS